MLETLRPLSRNDNALDLLTEKKKTDDFRKPPHAKKMYRAKLSQERLPSRKSELIIIPK